MKPRAEALNTLGLLALSANDFQEAIASFQRAAALWQTLGEEGRLIGTLGNLAVARTELGEPTDEAFKEALQIAKDHGAIRANVLLNIGRVLERKGNFDDAKKKYLEAASDAIEGGALHTSARAWNNYGVILHNQKASEGAEDAYRQALALARQAGETRLMAMVLGNLAELLDDSSALEEAILLLEKSGNLDIANDFKARLDQMLPKQVQKNLTSK